MPSFLRPTKKKANSDDESNTALSKPLVKLGIDAVILEEEPVCKSEGSSVKQNNKRRTIEDLMKEIKKSDKSDSESDFEKRLGHDISEDELSGDERAQMQRCILVQSKTSNTISNTGLLTKKSNPKLRNLRKKLTARKETNLIVWVSNKNKKAANFRANRLETADAASVWLQFGVKIKKAPNSIRSKAVN
jgi:hypothetical protein